ncbi:MAG: radical SAM protein [Candidatus ainarchaeum sp.]|nr:radical SAM protein [Candidatus ainarchaeum sp.]
MIFEGQLNYSGTIFGVLKKYNSQLNPQKYAGKIIYLERSINSILDYFPFIKGIVLKEGGILSHVAIVSREFNIPSIIGLNINDYFLDSAYVLIEKSKIIFTDDNYLVPTKNFIKLFKKNKDYYLIYKDTKKIKLDKNSFRLVKDLQTTKIKDLYKKYGLAAKKIIINLITDGIFCFSITKKKFFLYESDINSPDILDMQITTHCNMNCKFCYANINKKEGNNLDFKYIKTVFNDAKKKGLCFVSITGGEPTLHPDFYKIVNYAKSLGFAIHLNTNGTIINKKIISVLKKINNFGVSFDSIDEKDFLFLRGVDKKNRVLENIKKIINNGLNPTIVIVVNAINKKNIMQLVDNLVEVGVKKIKLNYFLPIGSGLNAKNLHIPYSQYIEIYNELTVHHTDIAILFDTVMFAFRFGLPTTEMRSDISCSAFNRRISINAFGEVNGCLLLPEKYAIGNIKTNSLEEILLKKPTFFKQGLTNSHCKSCKHKSCCGLGCLTFYKKNKGILDPRCPEVEKYESY